MLQTKPLKHKKSSQFSRNQHPIRTRSRLKLQPRSILKCLHSTSTQSSYSTIPRITPDQIENILSGNRPNNVNNPHKTTVFHKLKHIHDQNFVSEVTHIKSLFSTLWSSKQQEIPFTHYEEQILYHQTKFKQLNKAQQILSSTSSSSLSHDPHPFTTQPTHHSTQKSSYQPTSSTNHIPIAIPSLSSQPQRIERLLFNSLLLSAKPFLPSHFLTSLYRPNAYAKYSYHQLFSNIAGSAASVVSIQALLLAVGLSAIEATPAAAALTWVLKDLFGNVGGSLFASKASQNYELQPRLGRMRSALLYLFASFVEILAPLCHQQLLLLGTFTTLLKNVSWILTSSSRATTHLTFTPMSHIGEVTAKSGAQSTAAGVIGTSLGAGLSYWLTNWIPSANQPHPIKSTLADDLSSSAIPDISQLSTAITQSNPTSQSNILPSLVLNAETAQITTELPDETIERTISSISTTLSTFDAPTPHQHLLLLMQCSLFLFLSGISMHQLDKSLQHVYYNRFDLQRFTIFLNNLSQHSLRPRIIQSATLQDTAQPKFVDQLTSNNQISQSTEPKPIRSSTSVRSDSKTSIEDITSQESIYRAYVPPNNDLIVLQTGSTSTKQLPLFTLNKIFKTFKAILVPASISKRNPESQLSQQNNQLYALGQTSFEISETINNNIHYPYFLSIQPSSAISHPVQSTSPSSDMVISTPPALIALNWKLLDDSDQSPTKPLTLPHFPALLRNSMLSAQHTSAPSLEIFHLNNQEQQQCDNPTTINPHESQLLGLSHALIAKQLILQRYTLQNQVKPTNHDNKSSTQTQVTSNQFENNIYFLTNTIIDQYNYPSILPNLSDSQIVTLAGKILYSKSIPSSSLLSSDSHSQSSRDIALHDLQSIGKLIVDEIRAHNWDTTSVFETSSPIDLSLLQDSSNPN